MHLCYIAYLTFVTTMFWLLRYLHLRCCCCCICCLLLPHTLFLFGVDQTFTFIIIHCLWFRLVVDCLFKSFYTFVVIRCCCWYEAIVYFVLHLHLFPLHFIPDHSHIHLLFTIRWAVGVYFVVVWEQFCDITMISQFVVIFEFICWPHIICCYDWYLWALLVSIVICDTVLPHLLFVVCDVLYSSDPPTYKLIDTWFVIVVDEDDCWCWWLTLSDRHCWYIWR